MKTLGRFANHFIIKVPNSLGEVKVKLLFAFSVTGFVLYGE